MAPAARDRSDPVGSGPSHRPLDIARAEALGHGQRASIVETGVKQLARLSVPGIARRHHPSVHTVSERTERATGRGGATATLQPSQLGCGADCHGGLTGTSQELAAGYGDRHLAPLPEPTADVTGHEGIPWGPPHEALLPDQRSGRRDLKGQGSEVACHDGGYHTLLTAFTVPETELAT